MSKIFASLFQSRVQKQQPPQQSLKPCHLSQFGQVEILDYDWRQDLYAYLTNHLPTDTFELYIEPSSICFDYLFGLLLLSFTKRLKIEKVCCHFLQEKFAITIYFSSNVATSEIVETEDQLKNSTLLQYQEQVLKILEKSCRKLEIKVVKAGISQPKTQQFQRLIVFLMFKDCQNCLIRLQDFTSFVKRHQQQILILLENNGITCELLVEKFLVLQYTGDVKFLKPHQISSGYRQVAQELSNLDLFQGRQTSLKIESYCLIKSLDSSSEASQQLFIQFIMENDQHIQMLEIGQQDSIEVYIQTNSSKAMISVLKLSLTQKYKHHLQIKLLPVLQSLKQAVSLSKNQKIINLEVSVNQNQEKQNLFCKQNKQGQFRPKPKQTLKIQDELSCFLKKIYKNCPFITFLSQTLDQRLNLSLALYNFNRNYQVHAFENQETLAFFYRIHQYYLHKYPELYDIFQRQLDPQLNMLAEILGLQRFADIVQRKVKEQRARNIAVDEIKIQDKVLGQFAKELKIQKQNVYDRLLYELCKKYKAKSLDNKVLSIKIKIRKETVPIQQYLSSQTQFYTQSSVYQNIITKIKKAFESSLNYNGSKMKEFMANIERESVQSVDCLGCAQFFYTRSNLREDSINTVPIIFVDLKGQKGKFQLLQAICALLNSNGGIILLNCEVKELQIYPIGVQITQNQKIEQIQQIEKLLNEIRPKPESFKNIIIQFVPLKDLERNWHKSELQDMQFNERPYIRGRYVCRIKVRSNLIAQAYLLMTKEQYRLIVLQKYQRKQIEARNIRRYLRQVLKNIQKSSDPVLLKKQNSCIFSNFGHQVCKSPEKGAPIHTHFDLVKDTKSNYELQQQYDEMYLIICKQKYLPEVKARLQAKGIDCQLETKFVKYKFTSAKYTGVLYCDLNYQQLVKIVSFNAQFIFDKKMLIFLRITEFIKLQQRTLNSILSAQEYKNLMDWLHMQFPAQVLRIWECSQEGKKQYYLETQSKSSQLFLYYVMNNFNQKVSFKGPKGLDKLSIQSRNKAWQEIQNYQIINEQSFALRNIRQTSLIIKQRTEFKQQKNAIALYLLQRLRECFKKYKETNRLLRMENTLLKYLEYMLKKNLNQLQQKLISQLNLASQKAEWIIEKMIELPEIRKFVQKQNFIIYLAQKLRSFVSNKWFKKGQIEFLLSSAQGQDLSTDIVIQQLEEKGIQNGIQKSELAKGKAAFKKFMQNHKLYFAKYLNQTYSIPS